MDQEAYSISTEEKKRRMMRKLLLILSSLLLSLGSGVAPLVARPYFIHGGKRIWLTSWLQTAAFPLILIPLVIIYLHRFLRHRLHSASGESHEARIFLMKPPLFLASAFIGILTGLDDYLFSYGLARLPASTTALVRATHMGFTAAFAFVLVKQKFTFYSINSVALLTAGAGVLALHTDGDRPAGESTKQYIVGFVLTLAASALYGFVLPLIELTYKKTRQAMTCGLVMEVQFVICLFATVFCTVGMIIDNDFKVIPREARDFGLGETKYYLVLVWSGILWQTFFLGAVGVIFCGSSLLSGIIIAVMLPVTEILAVLFFKEKFQAEKGVSLVLSLWGFVSYFYGEIKGSKKKNSNKDHNPETELSQS